jgi:hypothetical protein
MSKQEPIELEERDVEATMFERLRWWLLFVTWRLAMKGIAATDRVFHLLRKWTA